MVADFESTPSQTVKGSRQAKAPTPAVAAIEITIVPEEEQKKEKPAKKARQSKSENLKSEKPKSARKRKSTAAAEPIAIEGSEASETASTANSDENVQFDAEYDAFYILKHGHPTRLYRPLKTNRPSRKRHFQIPRAHRN